MLLQHDIKKHTRGTSRLAMTSRMSFFNGRITTLDMVRAIAILCLEPHASADFDSDYLPSPVVTPFELLVQYPKTLMICGEKDPFVDVTVVFASRIQQAKMQHPSLSPSSFDSANSVVRVMFLEGISQPYLQMMAFYLKFIKRRNPSVTGFKDWLRMLLQTIMALSLSHTIHSSSSLPLPTHVDADISSNVPTTKRTMSPELAEITAAAHVAEIITSEKEMINHRKQQLVGLY